MSRVRFVDQTKFNAYKVTNATTATSASYADFATSASYAVSSSHEIIKEVSSSYADTASFAQSGNGTFSGSFSGSFEGDGSNLTGVTAVAFPFNGGAVITGSLTVSGSNSIVNLQETQFDTGHSASGHSTGRMYWSDDNKTINLDMQGSNVVLQLGQEEHVYIKNNSGVAINNGDAVRISGATGQNITVTKAVASIKSFKDATEQDQILGIATENIADNQFGYITTFGTVRGLNTSTFSTGDILYLSSTTSGSYSNIKPSAPYFEARVGVVEVVNATEGTILARPSEPIFLTDVAQITASGVIANEKTYLCYDDSTDLINFTNVLSGSFSGSFEGDGSNLTGIVSSSYALTASYALSSAGGGGAGFPFTGDAVITGSLVVSASATSQSLSVEGSGSTIFDVIGSAGILFTVSDGLDGELFAANNISGLPVISANADNTVKLGKHQGFGIVISGSTPGPNDNDAKILITGSIYHTGSIAEFKNTSTRFIGDTSITGSLVISGSSLPLRAIGSGSTVFDVIGSEGTLFSVDDDLNGMLFTTNDISGFPVLQASASGELYLGKSPQSLYTTAVISATSASATASVYSLSTSSYDGVFFDYTITSASNAQAGTIMSVWNGGTINHTNVTSSLIGSTSGIAFDMIISQSQAQLVAVTDSTSPNTWKVKTIIRSI